MKSRSYLYCALTTTLNIILNAVTFKNFLWLEGRVRGGRFRNWARQFAYRPANFLEPETEQEIVDLVKNNRKIRFFGSGHSFNAGIVSDETLVSLDKYTGLVKKDGNRVTVKGGTRMRDVVELLLENGLAFEALPSHDAQSIAGILSTNVHGTGKYWGFVAEMVESLKIIDGRGRMRENRRSFSRRDRRRRRGRHHRRSDGQMCPEIQRRAEIRPRAVQGSEKASRPDAR